MLYSAQSMSMSYRTRAQGERMEVTNGASGTWHLSLPAYRYSEAAQFAQTTPQSVSRWFRGYRAIGHQMTPVFPLPAPDLLSYLQLIETSLVATFRRLGVKLEELRRAHAYMRTQFGVEYPFARIELMTDGKDIFTHGDFVSNPDALVVLNREGQLAWVAVLGDRFAQFDYEDAVAMRWHPRGREHPIVIDPRISFGAPTVEGTGVPTYIVSERYIAGEDMRIIEEDFHLSPRQVREALEFEGLSPQAA